MRGEAVPQRMNADPLGDAGTPACQANDPTQLARIRMLPAVAGKQPGLTGRHPALLARNVPPFMQYLKKDGRENDVSILLAAVSSGIRLFGSRPHRDDGQIGTRVDRAGAVHDVECRDRTAKTPQLQVSEILQPRYRFDGASDAAADQDLPVLRLSTQPCGEVAYRADRGVAGAFGKADLAQGGVTLCDAGTETKFAAVAAPSHDQLARLF